MMNPYETLVQQMNPEQPAKVQVGMDVFNNVDVAENIGQDKLKKKPYNPYGLLVAPGADSAPVKGDSFSEEMLRDSKE